MFMDKKSKTSQKKENKTFWNSSIYTSELKPEHIIEPEIVQADKEESIIKEVKTEVKSFEEYRIRVNCPCLCIRKNPSLEAEEVGLITDRGLYIILDEENGFGKIGENQWIMLSFTKRA